jgi:hypothetical protein
MHTSLMGQLGLGLSGLWGRLEGDWGGDCSFGDGDLASEVGPIPENKTKQRNNSTDHQNTDLHQMSK